MKPDKHLLKCAEYRRRGEMIDIDEQLLFSMLDDGILTEFEYEGDARILESLAYHGCDADEPKLANGWELTTFKHWYCTEVFGCRDHGVYMRRGGYGACYKHAADAGVFK